QPLPFPCLQRFHMPIFFRRFRLRRRKPRVESVVLFVFLAFIALSSSRGADPLGRPAKDESPALQAAAALYDGIRTETLPNGLRVYLKPVPSSPVVTTMVAYKVG